MEEYAKELGFEIVGKENVDLKAIDATPQLLSLKKAEPDFVWTGGTTPSTAVIMKDAQKLGMTCTFFSNIWSSDENIFKLAGDAANGHYGLQGAAIYGQPSLATYSATKVAVRGLTEALDLEWHQFGIRVMSVWPLFVQTAMVNDMDAMSIKALGVKLTPQDVAEVIWQAAQHKGRPKVHWPVGLQSKLFQQTSKYSPEWLNRFINFHIAAKH